MASPKYYYNPKTLRYERARISLVNIFVTLIGLLSFGAVFFLGLFFLQNKLVVTQAERKLRQENTALRDHHLVIAAKLSEAKANLANLHVQEAELHTKFFDQAKASTKNSAAPEKGILIGDWISFDATLGALQSRFESSIVKALVTNDHYSRYASVIRSDIDQIRSFPGALPVIDVSPNMLVSGFGRRINPWHKGKYHHDGIDIAGARGTQVVATGKGRVILVKSSDLQAGFGNYIEVDHGYGYVTRYAHLGDIAVRAGQKVNKGEVIATMGISGGSIAPHVHYEAIKDGQNIDPLKLLVEGIDSKQFHLLAEAASKPNQSLD